MSTEEELVVRHAALLATFKRAQSVRHDAQSAAHVAMQVEDELGAMCQDLYEQIKTAREVKNG